MSKQKPADTEDELSVLLSTRNITIAGRGLVMRFTIITAVLTRSSLQ